MSSHYHSHQSEPKPKNKCGKCEIYKEQGDACQRTCAGLKQPCCIRFIVAPKGCYCKNGYARDTKCNRCIKIKSERCKRDMRPACGPHCNDTCGNPPGTDDKLRACCR